MFAITKPFATAKGSGTGASILGRGTIHPIIRHHPRAFWARLGTARKGVVPPMAEEITAINPDAVYDALRECYDPEIPVNIVDLGLVYDMRIEGANIAIIMTLTAIGCPVAGEVMEEVATRVKTVPGVAECVVELTFDPPWTTDRMSEDAKWELGIA